MYLKGLNDTYTQKSKASKKMKALNSLFMVLVFVVFALSINIDICFGASKFIHPLRPMKVTIMNSQTTDTLLAHCKSKNDDLGPQLHSFLFFFPITFR